MSLIQKHLSSLLSRKSLLFLCLSVASVATFPAYAGASALDPVNVFIAEDVSSNFVPQPLSIFYAGGLDCTTWLEVQVTGYADFEDTVFIHQQGTNVATSTQSPKTCQEFAESATTLLQNPNFVGSNYYTITFADGFNPSSDQVGALLYFYNGTEYSTLNLIGEVVTTQENYSAPLASTFNDSLNTFISNLSFNTNQLSVQYLIDEDEVIPSLSERNPSEIEVSYSKRPATDLTSTSQTITPWSFSTSTEQFDLSNLTNGVYDLKVQFTNKGVPLGSQRPFPDVSAQATIDVQGNLITFVGNVEYYNTRTTNESGYQACGITNLSGCISNAFLFLFLPSADSLQKFVDIKDSLETKFPFAYAYDFLGSVGTLYNNPSQNMPTLSVPWVDDESLVILSYDLVNAVPFVPTIRTLMGYLLWFGFAFTMYRRTLNIFNHDAV